jgi:hypothetical protein
LSRTVGRETMREPGQEGMAIEYKACRSSYVVFGIIFGTPLFLVSVVLIRGADPSWWQGFAVSSLALASSLLGLSRYRLVITPDAVAYSSLLHPRRKIRRSDIAHADFADETGPFDSPMTFVIRGLAGEELRINARVFSRDAVAALAGLSHTRSCRPEPP